MNAFKIAGSCSCYPCVVNARRCSSFTHRFDAQMAMHSAACLLLVSYRTASLWGCFDSPSSIPEEGLGPLVARKRRIDSAARRRPRRARPRASPLCSRSRPQGREEQCRTRTTLFVEAVLGRSQVLCLSNNKLSSQAAPVSATRRREALVKKLKAPSRGERGTRTAKTKVKEKPRERSRPQAAPREPWLPGAPPPRPDGRRARHARGHVAPRPHHLQ